jgi:putative transcriptional regulator
MKNVLRDLREARGWSQGRLAQLLGVSRQTINAVETDKYDPSLPLALRLAQLFGVNPQDIFLDDWVPETLTEDMLCAR